MHPTIRLGQQALQQAGLHLLRYYDRMDAKHPKPMGHVRKDVIQTVRYQCEQILQKNRDHYPIVLTGLGQTPDAEAIQTDKYWLLCPLDGITAFMHQIPQFCIALSFQIKHQTAHTMVYDPINHILYHASEGEGAYANDHRMRVYDDRALGADSLVGHIQGNVQNNTPCIQNLVHQLQDKQMTLYDQPSQILTMAYMAAGKLDAVLATDISPLTLCTTLLMIKEAGGLAYNSQGETAHLEHELIAANPRLMKALLQA